MLHRPDRRRRRGLATRPNRKPRREGSSDGRGGEPRLIRLEGCWCDSPSEVSGELEQVQEVQRRQLLGLLLQPAQQLLACLGAPHSAGD